MNNKTSRLQTTKTRGLAMGLVAAMFLMGGFAATYAFPGYNGTLHVFSAGTPIVASEVNANFDFHKVCISKHESELDTLAAHVVRHDEALVKMDLGDFDGVARAAVHIAADGSLSRYFNRLGGAPTISHGAGTNSYVVTFPGFTDLDQRFYSTTCGKNGGSGWWEGSASVVPFSLQESDTMRITTFDTSGTPEERGFCLIIH